MDEQTITLTTPEFGVLLFILGLCSGVILSNFVQTINGWIGGHEEKGKDK